MVVLSDYGRLVYCFVFNFEGYIIVLNKNMLDVRCEFFRLIVMLFFLYLDI